MSAPTPAPFGVSGTAFQCGQEVGLKVIEVYLPFMRTGVDATEFAQGVVSAGLAYLQANCGTEATRAAIDRMIAATETPLFGSRH